MCIRDRSSGHYSDSSSPAFPGSLPPALRKPYQLFPPEMHVPNTVELYAQSGHLPSLVSPEGHSAESWNRERIPAHGAHAQRGVGAPLDDEIRTCLLYTSDA